MYFNYLYLLSIFNNKLNSFTQQPLCYVTHNTPENLAILHFMNQKREFAINSLLILYIKDTPSKSTSVSAGS